MKRNENISARLVRPILGASLTVLVLTAAGCGASDHPNAASHGKQQHFDVSHSQRYASMSSLSGDSTLVVVGVAGASHVEELNGIPFTVTNVSVSQSGSAQTPATVQVRQTGTADVTPAESTSSSVLQSGQTYLLYLKPFELNPGVSTGQYVIVGDEGIWQKSKDSSTFSIAVTGTSLPQSVSVSRGSGTALSVRAAN